MRQLEACSEFEPVPAEYQKPWTSKDVLVRSELTGPREQAVAARGSPGKVEEEGSPAGVNPSLNCAPTSAHLASTFLLGQ